jgi:hypothetical protein
MGSGTFGYNNSAYGDNGWNDGALFAETGIAATSALGTEVVSGSSLSIQVGLDTLRLSSANLSSNVSGTATVNTVTGISNTTAIGNQRLWSLINTTSGGTEIWKIGTAN